MLTESYTRLCDSYPNFRKSTRKLLYQLLARYYQQSDWTYMNYGYTPSDEQEPMPALGASDEIERYCIQLYHHVVSAVPLEGLDVLEVGSGRGGGSSFVKSYFRPATMTGVDISDRAVDVCNRYYDIAGLSFLPGDAESLPFEDAKFDAVINIESSHCYGAMDLFLAEVKRVLREGGYFLFADFRKGHQLATLDEELQNSGMKILRKLNITSNVLDALDLDHDRRIAQIKRNAPWFLRRLVAQFAGTRNTQIYEKFRSGEAVYQSLVLQKTTA